MSDNGVGLVWKTGPENWNPKLYGAKEVYEFPPLSLSTFIHLYLLLPTGRINSMTT